MAAGWERFKQRGCLQQDAGVPEHTTTGRARGSARPAGRALRAGHCATCVPKEYANGRSTEGVPPDGFGANVMPARVRFVTRRRLGKGQQPWRRPRQRFRALPRSRVRKGRRLLERPISQRHYAFPDVVLSCARAADHALVVMRQDGPRWPHVWMVEDPEQERGDYWSTSLNAYTIPHAEVDPIQPQGPVF